jgi:hypothetical protein
MIRLDITGNWDELRADPATLQRYILAVYGADRFEMAPFPYTALLSADGQRLGLINTYGYPRVTTEGDRVWLELSDLLPAFGPHDRAAIRDRLAALAHESWSGWMKYQFGKGRQNKNGTWTMPKWAVERWTRQMDTPYDALPGDERALDFTEADKVLALLETLE